MQDGGWVEKEHKVFFFAVCLKYRLVENIFYSQVFYQSFKVNHMLISLYRLSTLHGALRTVSKEFSGVKKRSRIREERGLVN